MPEHSPDEKNKEPLHRDTVIRALNVKRYYGSGETVTKALDGISFISGQRS